MFILCSGADAANDNMFEPDILQHQVLHALYLVLFMISLKHVYTRLY